MTDFLLRKGVVYPGRGYEFAGTARRRLTSATLDGLSITGHLSSTLPTKANRNGTVLADTTVSLIATGTAGQYSGTLNESVVDPLLENRTVLYAIIDGPNIYEVTQLTVMAP